MFRIFVYILLIFFLSCIRNEDNTQSYFANDSCAPAIIKFDYQPFRWMKNSLFHLDSNTVNFKYDMLGHPVVQTKLDSGHECKLIFDTGSAGALILDKKFAEKCGLIEKFFPTENAKLGWNYLRDIPCMTLKRPVSISIGNSQVSYSECRILDGRFLNFLGADGIFSIPNEDTKVWEIDCENKRLSVLESPIFTWHSAISLRLERIGRQYVVRDFPFRFRHDNEFAAPVVDLVLDTGSPESLIYLYGAPDSTMQSALEDTSVQKYDLPSKNGLAQTNYLIREYGLLDRKLWISHQKLLRQWRVTGEVDMVVAGMDFIKSFNLRLYPSIHRIELIPIAYISLLEDQSRQDGDKNGFRAFRGTDGQAVIDFIQEGSFWQDYGLEVGDIILKADGQPLFDHSQSYFYKDTPISSHSFTIVRNRDTLKLGYGN